MSKYYCTVIFDASSTVVVEADTPEEAAEIAEDETSGNQHLCHQCANTLQTGDSIGVHVHNEECTEQLLDTTYRPPQQRTWVGLTEEEVIDCWPGLVMHMNSAEFWKNIEAKLKQKNFNKE
jgi:hypothetical protein